MLPDNWCVEETVDNLSRYNPNGNGAKQSICTAPIFIVVLLYGSNPMSVMFSYCLIGNYPE